LHWEADAIFFLAGGYYKSSACESASGSDVAEMLVEKCAIDFPALFLLAQKACKCVCPVCVCGPSSESHKLAAKNHIENKRGKR